MTTLARNGNKKDLRLPELVHSLDVDGDSIAFVEYRSLQEARGETISTVQALAVSVKPKDCSRIVKALPPLPPALNHLKRVKKTQKDKNNQNYSQFSHSTKEAENLVTTSSGSNSGLPWTACIQSHDPNHDQGHPIKRARFTLRQAYPTHTGLLILLGQEPLSVSHLIEKESLDTDGNVDTVEATRSLLKVILGEDYDNTIGGDGKKDPDTVLRSLLQTVIVPENPPQSHDQAKAANEWWPTQFFPLKSLEYRHQQLALPKEDMTQMHRLLKDYILDKSFLVAIVADPSCSSQDERRRLVATSWEEQELQQAAHTGTNNPLATPILWAIQGVARLERRRQRRDTELLRHTETNEDYDRKTQPSSYLCTQYELYCNYEPTVFEAMACVHSRFSRLIFTTLGHKQEGVLQKALTIHGIHCLPGTNHHFRALKYQGGSRGQSFSASICETVVVDQE